MIPLSYASVLHEGRARIALLLLALAQMGNMGCHESKKAVEAKAGVPVDTAIQPRLQWKTDGGFCGEASLQTAALHYGAWISQGLIRKAAGGELLLGVNEGKALKAFRLTHEPWDSKGQPKPHFKPFAVWLKGHLLQHSPCIVALYLAGSTHQEYDHIVPVSGFIPATDGSKDYDPTDVLIYHNLYSETPLRRAFHTLAGSRINCRYDLTTGGTLPTQTAYGVAVTGVDDPTGAALPVCLEMNRPDEPNWTRKEKPAALKGRVTVSGLRRGQHYRLMRFDRLSSMPLRGKVQDFLRARATQSIPFKAESSTWTFADPRSIPSNGATFYRCFPDTLEKKK